MTDGTSPSEDQPPSLLTLMQYVRSEIRASLFGPEPAPPSGDSDRRERERVLELELEQLPYNLMAARKSILRLDELLAAIAFEPVDVPNMPSGVTPISVILPHEQLPAAWTVDQFLDSGRRAQNALTRYVARAFKVSVPLSLNDYMSRPGRYVESVPAPVHGLLQEYWTSHGVTLKRYRDLAQHHAVVSSNMAAFSDASGPRVRLLLPSNPDETSLAKIAYGPPYVHASTYCRTEFLALLAVSYKLVYLIFRYLGVSQDASWSLLRPHPVPLGPPESFAPLPRQALDLELDITTRTSFNDALASYGALTDEKLRPPSGSKMSPRIADRSG